MSAIASQPLRMHNLSYHLPFTLDPSLIKWDLSAGSAGLRTSTHLGIRKAACIKRKCQPWVLFQIDSFSDCRKIGSS